MHLFAICSSMLTFQIFVTIITISIVIQATPVTNNCISQASNTLALVTAVSETQRLSLLCDRDFVYDFNNTVPTSNNVQSQINFAVVS